MNEVMAWVLAKVADEVWSLGKRRWNAACAICEEKKSLGNTTKWCCKKPICNPCLRLYGKDYRTETATFSCPLCGETSSWDDTPADFRDFM